MNILVAGVHGVGKTYLSNQLPAEFGFISASASQLIKEERSLPSWNVDKRVNDIDANQTALASAVKRYNDNGIRLLIDGHFILMNSMGEPTRLGPDVFKALNLKLVVLLESSPERIANRIYKRDDRIVESNDISRLMRLENEQARIVCKEIGAPVVILKDADIESFTDTIISAKN